MTQWCSAAARRMLTMATEQRIAYSSLTSSSSPDATSAAMGGPILCGRGDKRTKKGKRFKGSYGNSRPKKEKKIERIKDKVEVPRSTPWPLPFKLIWFYFLYPEKTSTLLSRLQSFEKKDLWPLLWMLNVFTTQDSVGSCVLIVLFS